MADVAIYYYPTEAGSGERKKSDHRPAENADCRIFVLTGAGTSGTSGGLYCCQSQ
jgi:hypothetical protein